ncbi:protein of unknown function [Micromonospora avicenniae]|uniref:Sialate O-acetylesterase domain-containing protein n=2 Tax=Micromonospora avicenniae TaxID=1198245 RepID=A0A1N6XYW4_9ACTN|nr:protein of unknown function [Micromonospora avicenniae]
MSDPFSTVMRRRRTARLVWVALGALGVLVACIAAAAWAAGDAASPRATATAPTQRPIPVDGTSCAANVGSMSEFTPLAELNLPERANWLGRTPPYTFDRSRIAAAGAFDRVGYCLELRGPGGVQWVWSAMEPFTRDAGQLGLPTREGQIVRQRVDDLEVASNVAGLQTGTGLSGYLEMWPNSYGPDSSGQIAGASAGTFDADDDVLPALRYGSFQVHLVGSDRPSTSAPQTVFAINGYTSTGGPLSVGIGSAPRGNSDWTFAGNAGSWTERRLTVYARSALLDVDRHPEDRQLYPRDAANGATVTVAGKVRDSRVKEIRLQVTSDQDRWEDRAQVTTGGEFSFERRITAALRDYRFELRAVGEGLDRRVGLWEGVVAGDVYIIQGQSNAVSAPHQGSSAGEESPFIRSYGSSTPDPGISAADRSWHYGVSEAIRQPGSVGQWGIRMAHQIVDTYRVPVAIFNGADNGRSIWFFQRNDADPGDLETNYGRLRQRLIGADVIGQVRGVFWYQGESDDNNVSAHLTGFSALLADWRREIGREVAGGSRYYVFQVRTSPCGDSSKTQLREAQRRLGDTSGVTVLSTTGLSGHQGCHFAWEQGYRELGDHTFAVVARDLYAGPSDGVLPPNPQSAAFADAARTELVIRLRADDVLTVDPGVGADFRIDGSTVTVTDVQYRDGGQLVLRLSGSADGATGVSYRGHSGAGPWIANATGAGLLAFDRLPIGGASR